MSQTHCTDGEQVLVQVGAAVVSQVDEVVGDAVRIHDAAGQQLQLHARRDLAVSTQGSAADVPNATGRCNQGEEDEPHGGQASGIEHKHCILSKSVYTASRVYAAGGEEASTGLCDHNEQLMLWPAESATEA